MLLSSGEREQNKLEASVGKGFQRTPGTVQNYDRYRDQGFKALPDKRFYLAWSRLSESDQKYALKTVLKLTTGIMAQDFVLEPTTREEHPGWTFRWLDQHGVVGVLAFRGVDVKGYYKRQTVAEGFTDLESPTSMLSIKHQEDLWIAFDLSGASARQLKQPTLDRMKKLEEENRALKSRIKSQEDSLEAAVAEIASLKPKVPQVEKVRPNIRLEKSDAKTEKGSSKSAARNSGNKRKGTSKVVKRPSKSRGRVRSNSERKRNRSGKVQSKKAPKRNPVKNLGKRRSR